MPNRDLDSWERERLMIYACAAPLSASKSALKGNAPANRAIVKCTKIAEITEYGVTDPAPWHKEFPQSKGDFIVRLSMTLLTGVIATNPFAIMRLLALLLSNLLVVKGPSAMLMIRVSGKILPSKGMIIGRIPSSGSTKVCFSLKLPTSSLPTGGVPAKPMRALRRLASLGELPFTTRKLPLVTLKIYAHPRSATPIFVGEPKRIANANENVAASAKGKRDMLDLWLVDAGCGHHLVSSTNVKLSGGETT